jgi:hypothetical protein
MFSPACRRGLCVSHGWRQRLLAAAVLGWASFVPAVLCCAVQGAFGHDIESENDSFLLRKTNRFFTRKRSSL